MFSIRSIVLGLVPVLFGCQPFDEGGGGGLGIVNFTEGFVFVRKDDRNLYITDKIDYSTIAKVTSHGGNRHPSLSKDGSQIVFVHTTGSTTSIQIAQTAAGETPATVATSDSSKTSFKFPVFSPDGNTIVFAYDSGSSSYLGKIPANANNAGTIIPIAGSASAEYSAPSFYPDGLSVLAAFDYDGTAGGYLQLEKVLLNGGGATNISSTLGAGATAIVGRAVISPDGTRAAFDGKFSSGVRTFVMNLTTKAVIRVTDYADTYTRDSFPTWVSNAEIGFSSDSGGNDNVYILSASPPTPTSGGLTVGSALEPWYGEKI
jgi:TolB protein